MVPVLIWSVGVAFVGLLVYNRSAYVLAAHLPKSDAIPSVHAEWGPYLAFDLNYSTIWAIATELYYFILTPSVTVSYPSAPGYTHYEPGEI